MNEALEPGRTIFQSLSPALVAAFYAIAFLAMGVFAYGCWRRIAKYRSGQPAQLSGRRWQRAFSLVATMAAHSTLRKRDGYAGLAHAMIFWGFVVLFMGSMIIAIDQDLLRHLAPGFQFWRGDFYKFYSLGLDLMGLGLLTGLIMMAGRRWVGRPPRLDYVRPDRDTGDYDRSGYVRDDQILLWGLILIVLTGFLNEGLRIAITRPPFEIWSIVGWYLAGALGAADISGGAAAGWHAIGWWLHGVLALAFIAYLPFSKAVHMLLALAGLFFRDPLAGKRLPDIPLEATQMGYGNLGDFSWKELLDLDSCTRCGRCHESCPAASSGWPLSPRDVILQLREVAQDKFGGGSLLHEKYEKPISGLGIRPETLWSCTTCLACVEICPVGVEHVPLMVQMRRNLVEQGDMDGNLQATLERLMRYGNSFGQPESERGNWTGELDFQIKDARETPVDYLWFVGDYASYDPKVRRNTQVVARIFHAAGLDFGILKEGERNAGNDIRRAGEEGLFELLREHNEVALSGVEFKTIVTTDPHSYNTLKFEYPELDCDIRHYTEVIHDLITDGSLPINKPLSGCVTYHDPCHLSRYSALTDAPRNILEALGLTLVEMRRNRANSFCCGAGGGRIWMAETSGAERPGNLRIEEALEIGGIKDLVVACPKCFTMCREAVTSTGNEAGLHIRDIIEYVGEAVAPDG